jgi:hypothetical protein
LQDERDVYREIQKLCGELKCEGKVDYWNVDWLESSDITRPVANATDITKVFHRELKMGLRKLFHFSVGEHAPATAVTSLILQQFTCGCSKCANFEFDSTYQVEHCTAHKQLCGICHLKREDNRGVVAKRAKDLQASLELARKLPIGDIVALETGDFRRTQREGGGSQHTGSYSHVSCSRKSVVNAKPTASPETVQCARLRTRLIGRAMSLSFYGYWTEMTATIQGLRSRTVRAYICQISQASRRLDFSCRRHGGELQRLLG